MSDNNPNLIQNILNKKFTKANVEFADMMRNKVYKAVDDFKKDFKYVTTQEQEKVPETQEKTDG